MRAQAAARWMGVAIMALALRASAQVTVGDNISMNLNGQASFGYNADYGSTITSDHGLNFGGTGNPDGLVLQRPNFLNFDISPYYNQSRANSSSSQSPIAAALLRARSYSAAATFLDR